METVGERPPGNALMFMLREVGGGGAGKTNGERNWGRE